MEEDFHIYTDRLREGKEEKISFTTSPEFLDVDDDLLRFEESVEVRGVAYLAEDELIMRLDVQTRASIPCSRCNAWCQVPLELDGVWCAIPLAEVKHRVFDFSGTLREEIILAAPMRYSCCEQKD